MDHFASLEKAVQRLNPMPAKRRQWADERAAFDDTMSRLDANLERSRTAWIIAAAEAGRVDPDPFFSKGNDNGQ